MRNSTRRLLRKLSCYIVCDNIRKEYENQNERQKISYDAEAKILKEDRQRLDEIRE